jgi:hypothetical protein
VHHSEESEAPSGCRLVCRQENRLDKKLRLIKFPANEPRSADADTISRLEWLLDAARSGEIVGLAFVTLQPAGEVGMGWTEGCTANRLSVVGGVSCLEALMHKTLVEI